MNSDDLEGFEQWQPFKKKDDVRLAPKECGVYVIRQESGKPCPRLRGTSDILYIGSTTCKEGLKKRFEGYFSSATSNSATNLRINGFLDKYPMEITWRKFGFIQPFPYKHNEAINLEGTLLAKYWHEHDELPPFNQSDVKRRFLYPDNHGILAQIKVEKVNCPRKVEDS